MRGLICIALVLVLPMPVLGADAAANVVPDKLSLSDAVKLVLDVNVNLKDARSQHLTSISRLRIASLQTTYSIGANTSIEHDPSDTNLSNSVFGSLGYESLYGTQASLDVSPLGTGSQRGNIALSIRHPLTKRKGPLSVKADTFSSALSETVVQDKQLYQTVQSNVLSVIRAYFSAVEAGEQVKVQEKAVQLVEQSAVDARKREEAGYARGIDVYRAEVQVQQTKERLNVQRESAKATVDRLMLAIGFGIGKTPELTDKVPDAALEVPTLEDAIAKAQANRSELTVYDERRASQLRRLAIAEEEFRPGLDAVAQFNSSNKDQGLLSTSIFDVGSTVMGLELRMPLDRRAIKEEREIVARDLGILDEQRKFQIEQISEEVRSAYRSLESTATSLGILKQNLDVAQQNLHIAERMVEEGEGDNRDVLSAQESLANAESGIISAKTDLYLAAMELSYAMGEDITRMDSK